MNEEYIKEDAQLRVAWHEELFGKFNYIEVAACGTPEENVAKFKEYYTLMHGGAGIPADQFRDVVDNLVAGVSVNGGVELWEKMSNYQKDTCQEIKRSKKRIDYKNNKE